MRRGRTLLWWAIVALVLTFVFAPVVLVVLFSFNAAPSSSFPIKGLTFHWYGEVFDNPLYVEALQNSAVAAIATAIISTLVGAAASVALSRHRSRTLDVLSAGLMMPLMLPGLFIGVALLSFASRIHLQLSLVTVVIGHVIVTVPLVVLIVNARLMQLDWSVVEAARDLGASGATAFRRVILPQVLPALIGAGLLALAWSADELIITLFTNGGDTTVPVLIMGLTRRGLDPSINAVASLILCSTVVSSLIAARFISPRDVVA
jgi:spermidine/putrescine transport system permease protein